MDLKYLFLALFFLPFMAIAQSPDSDLGQIVKDYLAGEEGFSGVVMVAQGGKPLVMEGYGMVDAESELAIDVNTLFDIGSIAKPFTATAILKLSEAGKLSVQDPLSQYFEGLPEEKGKITIHQLLTHSAGLPGALGPDFEAIDRDEYLQRVAKVEFEFEPGTSYAYSNVGYSLLAMIIEDLSGKSYDQYLREDVIFPAKMLMTGYHPRGIDYMAVAPGVNEDGSDWGKPHEKNWDGEQPYWHLRGNGGILSSASDMFRLYKALSNGLLLGGEATKAQFMPHVDEGGGFSYYGYGWVVMNDGQHIAHNGGNGIFRADFHWLPSEDCAIFVASNDARVPLFEISENVLSIVMSGEAPRVLELQEVNLKDFPADARQKTAQAFLENVQDPHSAKAGSFIDTHFTEGIVERNTKERLVGIFEMIHADHPKLELIGVQEDDTHIQLITSAGAEGPRLTFLLRFLEDQIDGIELEAN
ncbi:MAG: beta-lactamase family protein [Bacteroidetes bacterium]|nr:beta-lactamase family protein [Bacteroidota bacterium]